MTMFGRIIAAGAASINTSKELDRIDREKVIKFAEKLYPEDKTLHAIMKKDLDRLQHKDLEASIPSAGGYGIPQILSPDIVRVLYNKSILDQVGAVKYPMPNGNFRMVRMDTASTVGWIGEDTANDPTEPVFGDINLNAKKLYAMVPVSNSLLRYNAVGIDSWVSQDLTTKARRALDTACLYGTGNSYQPKGITNMGIQTCGSSTTSFTVAVPQAMTALLEAANVPMISPAWVMNPLLKGKIGGTAFSTGPFAWALEMNQSKTLNGHPFVSSAGSLTYSSNTYADLWLGDWSEFIWGVGYDLSVEISREGTYVSSSTTYSAFQRDVTLIRLIAEHDFDCKHPVSFIQGTYLVA
jgi:HK97 family phage major capsid protein